MHGVLMLPIGSDARKCSVFVKIDAYIYSDVSFSVWV